MTVKQETVPINSRSLKEIVRTRGLKKDWLAYHLGVSRITVSRWINGHVKSIQRSNLEALVAYLECDESELVMESFQEGRLATWYREFLNSEDFATCLDKSSPDFIRGSWVAAQDFERPHRDLAYHLSQLAMYLRCCDRHQQAKQYLDIAQALAKQDNGSGLCAQAKLDALVALQSGLSLSVLLREIHSCLESEEELSPNVFLWQAELYWQYGDFYQSKVILQQIFEYFLESTDAKGRFRYFQLRLLLALDVGDWVELGQMIKTSMKIFAETSERRYWKKLHELLEVPTPERALGMKQNHCDQLTICLTLELLMRQGDFSTAKTLADEYVSNETQIFDLAQFDFLKAIATKKSDELRAEGHLRSCLEALQALGARKRIPLYLERFRCVDLMNP
ncbi:helix-turn-helix domain-containing protein [Pseudobacteriovorax antillogorgiicola]|uniref:DNA-binding transcriptional regulator, XRE family n=1 Tax=Pseudobacteriovorax antillogorgiicola TaxID=1513793 RepID=A0A1Y6CEA5_9BACT|nr:helix-turn-helix transcriptional regulator [Pseudobacteriovorax antillogorgiicola]TCS47655.1 DNA-binding Xre family transcriptional regulator [Pseudobacteriovorax antillogorgiicola]SMF59806.1 DNA-binding transcriptional regulator, XRE family [Pseudobacteriovorax antillogorgiicola]